MPADRILVIDPDPTVADALRSVVKGRYTIESAATFDDIFHTLIEDSSVIAVVAEQLADHSFPTQDAITTLRKRRPLLPIVVVSGSSDSSAAIQFVQSGAYDYLPKPAEAEELKDVIEDAIDSYSAMGRKVALDSSADENENDAPTDTIVGRSRAMAHVYRDIARVAATPVTVLIRGETGTGKELVARALHQHGHRAHHPLISVNCAAIPANLLESELFGHEKGAFTGATSSRIGRFEQAHGATLFLDEIGDMDLPLQAKLLRVLQQKVITRVGGTREIPVDVRFIAATHQPIEQMIEQGKFREDLLYRLNAATIHLPPLRDRIGDVRILIQHFLRSYSRELKIDEPAIEPAAISKLERDLWPGNVRQLQNVVRRALLQRQNFAVRASDIEQLLDESAHPADSATASLTDLARGVIHDAAQSSKGNAYREMHDRIDEILIPLALEQSGNNLAKAARWLGISRVTLREKLKSH